MIKVDGRAKFWAKLDVKGNWTVICMKVEGPLDKTWAKNDQSVKLDGAKVWKWAVKKWQIRRSESVIVDGPKVSKSGLKVPSPSPYLWLLSLIERQYRGFGIELV